jgi:YgiT-type zinc finger domain-containing protein
MCPVCKGDTLEERIIRTMLEYRGRVYIFDNAPAEVCSQCGEVLLRPEVAKELERLVRDGVAPSRSEAVPVYDLRSAA